jgi:hypothetical protein
LSVLLRPGNAGSNTAADHVTVIREGLRHLPGHRPGPRPARKILTRVDSADATHEQRDPAEPPPGDRIGDLAAQARESSGCATTAITRNNQ